MSEVPPEGSDGERVEESSHEESGAMSTQGLQVGEGGPGPGQPQVERPATAEWWRIDAEPSPPGARPSPTAPTPPTGTPPSGTPPFGTPPSGSTPPFGTPPPPTPPPGTPPWTVPGWGAPPWAGAPPQWYGWGPGWPGGPPQPPSDSSSSPSPRHHPRSWVIVGGLLAAIAMVALGVGIGYSVWGGASAPAASRHRVTVPFPRVSPFTRASTRGLTRAFTGVFRGLGRGGFLGVKIEATPSVTTTSGAHVEGVVASSPAAKAGIVKGDTITEFDTRSVASARTLEIDVVRMSPGSRVKVEWVTPTGKHESATVTLASRPATSPLG